MDSFSTSIFSAEPRGGCEEIVRSPWRDQVWRFHTLCPRNRFAQGRVPGQGLLQGRNRHGQGRIEKGYVQKDQGILIFV